VRNFRLDRTCDFNGLKRMILFLKVSQLLRTEKSGKSQSVLIRIS